jgi:RNA polymerase sigma factor (sigma-70 family)
MARQRHSQPRSYGWPSGDRIRDDRSAKRPYPPATGTSLLRRASQWPMSPWLSDRFLSSQSDERLLSLARAGHDQAFAAIVQRYRRQLYAAARRLSTDGRAEDLVQQTFLSALAALRAGIEVRHLRGWLHQILRNVALRTRASADIDLDPESGHAATDSAQQVAERRMRAVGALSELARLPSRQHEALVQTAIQGRSRAEVAGSMGLSEGAVRQLVHRARETLRSVTALTPYPVARALGVAQSPSGSGSGLPEVAIGAGSASAGGIAVKVGALVASGVLAAGIVSSGARHASQHVLDRHGSAVATGSGNASGAHPLAASGGAGLLVEAGGALQAPTAARTVGTPKARHRTEGRSHSGGSGDRSGGSGRGPSGNRGGDSSNRSAAGSGGDQQSGGGADSGGGSGPGSGGGGGTASGGGGGSSDGGGSGSGSSGSDGGSGGRPSGGQLGTGGGGMNSGGHLGSDGGGSGPSRGGSGSSGGSGSGNPSGPSSD